MIALYKTWRGNEFVIESVESIYNHVEKIVFVHSEVSWNGERGNYVVDRVNNWKYHHDTDNKIISISFDSQNQLAQYKFGIDFIHWLFGKKDILFIDTDEIWEDKELEKLKWMVNKYPNFLAYGVRMHTYIKSPFYRIEPDEGCMPTVYFKGSSDKLEGIRGIDCNRVTFENIHFHHFTYVRENEDDLFKKIDNVYKTESETDCIDLQEWKINKWDKLPHSTNLHTAKGYEHLWEKIRVISKDELPEVLHNNPIVRRYE